MSDIQQTEIRERLDAIAAARQIDTVLKWVAGVASALLVGLVYWAGGQLIEIKDSQTALASDVRVVSEALKSSVELHGQNLLHANRRIDRLEEDNRRMRDTIERLMTRIRANPENPLQP